jgi:Poly-gamma-glutamate hydrolase
MEDEYASMTDLYGDPANIEGTTYGKRWRRHEWIQIVEAQATDNAEGRKIVLAVHGGGIEGATSEVALAVAGYHPATFAQTTDCLGLSRLLDFRGPVEWG